MDVTSRDHVATWVGRERREYADIKYAEGSRTREHLKADIENNPGLTEFDPQGFEIFIGNYLKRVQQFTLATPQGRQAMGKLIVTCLHALETAVDIHGPMPQPAVSSGEIVDWTQDA